MRYKCVNKDQHDTWFSVGKEYEGEPMIPPLTSDEVWLKIYRADDGKSAYVRAKQFMQIIDRRDVLDV